MTPEVSRHGFEAAVRRARAGVDQGPAAKLAALAECVWWAVAADERLRALGGRAYRAERDADPDGRLLPAVAWARSRPEPDDAMVLQWDRGAPGHDDVRATAAAGGYRVVWRPACELPFGQTRSHQRFPFGRQEYRTWLEGRAVDETVEALARWFRASWERLGEVGPADGRDEAAS